MLTSVQKYNYRRWRRNFSWFRKTNDSIVKKGLKKKGDVNIHTKAMAKGVEETETGVKVTLKLTVKEKSRS